MSFQLQKITYRTNSGAKSSHYAGKQEIIPEIFRISVLSFFSVVLPGEFES
jgi:hypothetical protein